MLQGLHYTTVSGKEKRIRHSQEAEGATSINEIKGRWTCQGSGRHSVNHKNQAEKFHLASKGWNWFLDPKQTCEALVRSITPLCRFLDPQN